MELSIDEEGKDDEERKVVLSKIEESQSSTMTVP